MAELSGLAVSETPSQSIVTAGQRAASAPDSKGRIITCRMLSPVDLFRLTKMLGASASNQATLNLAMSACSVTAIDGDAITAPATEREIEAVLQRLGFEGLEAVGKALVELAISPEAQVEQAKN